eukprot:6270200-Prymnesium_polylepis.1
MLLDLRRGVPCMLPRRAFSERAPSFSAPLVDWCRNSGGGGDGINSFEGTSHSSGSMPLMERRREIGGDGAAASAGEAPTSKL